jgi:BON domain
MVWIMRVSRLPLASWLTPLRRRPITLLAERAIHRFDVWKPLRRILDWALLAGALTGFAPPSTPAAEVPPPRIPAQSLAGDFPLLDCQRALRARQALLLDSELASLNVGVSVHGGIVTLWGVVPGSALAKRAAERVQRVPGVLQVHSELHILPANDPLTEYLLQPLPREEMPAPAGPPTALTGWPGNPLTPPPAARTARPSGVLVPRIALPERPGSTERAPSAVLLRPTGLHSSVDLNAEVDRLRQEEVRFRWVRSEVSGGVVHLRGFVHRWEDVFDLARAAAQLPGVERVVLEGIHLVPQKR